MSKYVIQGINNNQTSYASMFRFSDDSVIPMWYELPDRAVHFDTKEEAEETMSKFPADRVNEYDMSIIEVEYPSLLQIVDDYGEIEDPEKFDLIDFTHYVENSLGNKYDVTILATDDWPKSDMISMAMCQVLGKNLTKFDIKVATLDVYDSEDLCIIAIKKEE